MDKQTFISQIRSLQSGYQPNQDVLDQLAAIKLIAVVGPTGAGKSTIVKQAGIPFVVGDTTRLPRETEVQGRDYNFRTDFDAVLAEIKNGEYVQFVIERESELYGTKSSSYPMGGVCAISIMATALSDFRNLGFGVIQPVYVVPPSHTEWMHRIATHKDKDLESRLMEAKESLKIALNDQSYVFIMNDNLESAVATLKSIMGGTVDFPSSARARASAITLYEHVQRSIR